MNSFISSGNIEAFPAALRNQGTGKYTTEDNLATIFRAAAGRESFVVNASPLEFVVHGHYFKWTESLTSGDTNLTAYIVEDSSTKTLRNVDDGSTSLDDSGNFKGVTFSLPSPSGSGLSIYSLQITDGAGKLINEIPRLSAITVGAGLSTDVSGSVITSTGSIFMPAIDYNGSTISGSYGPTHTKNEVDYSALTPRIPRIKVDDFGKIIEANTYIWTGGNRVYQGLASNYERPILFGSQLTSYTTSGGSTYWIGSTYYNSSVKIDMTGQSAVLVAPKFSGEFSGAGSFSGDIYQTFAPNSTGYQAFLTGSRTTSGHGSIYFARNNTGIDLKSGWITANQFNGLLFSGPLSGNATTATTADKAISVNQAYTNLNNYRPLALAGLSGATSTLPVTTLITSSVFYNTQIFANTNTGTLYAKKFVGEFEGTITTVAETAKFYNGTTIDAYRALIFATINSGATGTITTGFSYTTNIYTNPSKGYVYANRFIGPAASLTIATAGGNGKMLMWREGKPAETTTTRGFLDITNQKAQAVYMDNGTITSGQTIYWSTSSATGGAVGDIWIQY